MSMFLSYLSSLIDFYQRYVDFLVRNGEAEKAAAVAESGRARLLDERLNAAGTAPLLTTAAFTQLARSSGTVILSYWLAPDRSFLWAITPAGVTLHVLPGEKQIAALVESYRSFIESLRDPLESEFPAGRKLSEILLGPVRPLLGRGTRIIVVPDRALNSLNFETLPDPEDNRHYLIDRVTVAVAPSLDLLAASKRTRPVVRSLLLIGNPETAVEEYPKLPYAAKEMELIGQSVAFDRVLRIEGAQAYPAAYREATPSRFSWIHFAAHASSNRENPLESALILSRRDGAYTLSAREVMKIALDADLVTLSACRSAGAKILTGRRTGRVVLGVSARGRQKRGRRPVGRDRYFHCFADGRFLCRTDEECRAGGRASGREAAADRIEGSVPQTVLLGSVPGLSRRAPAKIGTVRAGWRTRIRLGVAV